MIYYFLGAGELFGVKLTVAEVEADAAGEAEGVAAADDAAPAGAGRIPLRLLGLLNIFCARLLTILASFMAVVSNAVFRSDRR